MDEVDVDNMGKLSKAKSLILTNDVDMKIREEAWKRYQQSELPYYEHFEADNGQFIDYLGTIHITKEDDEEKKKSLLNNLESRFLGYLEQTNDNPESRLIVIEGSSFPEKNDFDASISTMTESLNNEMGKRHVNTLEEAVELFGEAGYMMWKAKELDLPIVSFEPSDEVLAREMVLQGVDPEDIALKYAILYMDVYVHRGKSRDQKKFEVGELAHALRKACEFSGWNTDLVTQFENDDDEESFVQQLIPRFNERMKKNGFDFGLVNEDYSWAYDPRNKQIYNLLHSPLSENEKIRKMAKISGGVRDKYMVEKIKQATDEGKSPFILYGSGHLVNQRPALEYMYNNLNDIS